MSKLVHNTKTSLAEEAKQYVPKIRELYPNLDNMLVDRISKYCCLLYTSPSPRDRIASRMPSSA